MLEKNVDSIPIQRTLGNLPGSDFHLNLLLLLLLLLQAWNHREQAAE